MSVAMFIGLWIYDELSFNRYHENYDDIAQVWSGGTDPETFAIDGSVYVEYPMAAVLRSNYQHYFKHVLMAGGIGDNTLTRTDKKVLKKGMFIEGGAPEMLSLKMLKGSYESLTNLNSIILSKATALSIFGDEDPINKRLNIDNRMEVQVTGVYEDIPKNNRFSEVQFFSPWSLWLVANDRYEANENDWDNRPVNIYVQLQPNISMETANAAIKDLYYKNVPADFLKVIDKYKPFPQVIPMSTWHLYSEFKDGMPAQGRITYVWLFGVIGIFVLLLACINFMNLSTARSEKRAREVGVRKAVGSGKRQLIFQFLSESLMVVVVAFIFSMLLLGLLRGWFNELSDKDVALPLDNPAFWAIVVVFIVFTGFMAGLYPAFYLSSFQPVKVLKGSLGLGRFAAVPRRVLVVVQFTVSVILIIGTLVVYQQIQYARSRPVGYERESLITVAVDDPNFKGKLNVLGAELLNTGVVSGTALSSSPLTAIWNTTGGYNWRGKDPNLDASFAICNVTLDFGKTINWELIAGRDFSSDLATDSTDAIAAVFDYDFVDDEYALKFSQEERIGKLSSIFSALAIFISCLGLFGLASFVAEQRTKEIGIRKVMGASVSNLWKMLSKDFVVLVIISCVIAIPLSYFLMSGWLQKYEYRTEISGWIFLMTCVGALVITLLTVSFQAVRAALMNPVKSLKSE